VSHDLPYVLKRRRSQSSVILPAVVFDDDVLHRLHEPALDVARLRRLDRGVDETLAPTHRVEKALLRREAAKVRVLDEAAALGPIVILGEVGERALQEAKGEALALDSFAGPTHAIIAGLCTAAAGAAGAMAVRSVALYRQISAAQRQSAQELL